MSWSSRYLSRLLGRNLGRSILSLLLAALLALAFGLVTVLRGMYAELYKNVEVQGTFAPISYERALRVGASPYVLRPEYSYVAQGVQVELDGYVFAEVQFTNRMEESVTWAEGWDEEAFFQATNAVCVLSAAYGESLGKGLGDRLRVNEQDWLSNLSKGGSPFREGETLLELRDRRRPFVTIVGLYGSPQEEHRIYVPAEAYQALNCLYTGDFVLDFAEYTLADYSLAEEFREYAKGILDGMKTEAAFHMDTSYADRVYEMHRLLETLYPITVAAALLLGGVLPGLMVLHVSRELSILRALGVRTGRCTGLYTLAQVLCAALGLVLGLALALTLRKADPGAVLRPFALYLAAHLAACALGSGIFAWLCARKHVLAQLQAKE